FALYNGGAVVVMRQREATDAAGNWTIPVAVTPTSAGPWLLCGYTDDGMGSTLGGGSFVLDIKPAPTPPAAPAAPPAAALPAAAPSAAVAAKPVNTTAPRVRRSGSTLVCDPGRWSSARGAFAFRWSVNGKRKQGANGRKLHVTRALRGRKLACRVTAS